MTEINKVIIMGAGPAGVLAALRLHHHNRLSPVIYEIRPGPHTIGGAVGIPSNGLTLLHRLGLYEEIAARASSNDDLTIHSSHGHVIGKKDLVGWSKKRTGFGYLRVRRTDLMEILLSAAKRVNIPVHFGKEMVSIEEKKDEVTVKFSDGTSDTADVLLGCDGVHSAVRTSYVDPDAVPTYSGVTNVGSIIPTARLPPAAKSLSGLNVTVTPSGIFVLIPCDSSGNEMYWFFSRQLPAPSSDSRDGWEEHRKAEIANTKETLLTAFGDTKSDWMDLLRAVVEETKEIKCFPIFKLASGGKWHRGRCLLIGDAAHAMPPHASQGVSMALEDIFLLSNLLATKSLPNNEVISNYEAKRRPRVEMIAQKAQERGEERQERSRMQLLATETGISIGLSIYNMLNLDRFGMGQKYLAYDIETEKI